MAEIVEGDEEVAVLRLTKSEAVLIASMADATVRSNGIKAAKDVVGFLDRIDKAMSEFAHGQSKRGESKKAE